MSGELSGGPVLYSEEDAKAWLADFITAEGGDVGAAMVALERLVAMLTWENAEQNLVSAASLGEVWRRQIVDSAQLLRFVPRETCGLWLDLGTGAGFPGLVVAALRPEMEVLMVESRARRIEWLERARDALGLERASVIGQRLELVETRKVDAISARAFAPLDRLLALSARFSTADTLWLLPKGRSAAQDLETLPALTPMRALSGRHHTFHVEQSLTDAGAGILVGNLKSAREQTS